MILEGNINVLRYLNELEIRVLCACESCCAKQRKVAIQLQNRQTKKSYVIDIVLLLRLRAQERW